MGRLDGKVCVITGAGGGMGRDAALLFTEEGAQVCAADVNFAAAEETVAQCSGDAFAQQVDVADEASVVGMMDATVERFGGIDVLYNNAGISPDDRVAREEVFGPVAALIPFDDEADAIRIANDSPYGLSGSIWTQNGARALRVARALETGVLSINSNSSVRVSTPFGGFKQSGFGRELGMHGLEGYSEVKNVYYSTEG